MTSEELRILRESCADEASFLRARKLFDDARQTDAAYRLTFEEARDALWVLRPDLSTDMLNRRMRDLLPPADSGDTPDVSRHFSADVLQLMRELAQHSLPDVPALELQMTLQNGERRTVECKTVAQPGDNDASKPAGRRLILRIGESNQVAMLEAHLDKSRRDFETIFHTSGHALILLHPVSEEILDINNCACELFGIPRERLLGVPLLHIAPVADAAALRLEEVEGRSGLRFRTVQYNRAGVELSLEISACIVAHNGKPAVLCCVYDRSAESELVQVRGTSAYFKSVFDAAGVGLLTIDPNGMISNVNRAAETILGYEKHQLHQADLSVLLHPADTLIDQAFIREMSSSSKQMIRLPRRLRVADGRFMWFISSLAVVADPESGAFEFLVLSFEDLSTGAASNTDMRLLLEAARRSDVRKSRLLTALNQAVRSPVNGILGFANYLQNTDLGQQETRALRAIMSSAESILSTVSNTTLFAQLDELSAETHFSPMRIDSEITEIWRTYSGLTSGGDTQLLLDNRAEAGIIRTDSQLFSRMLANVVANAVRFTPHGAVHIDVHTEDAVNAAMLVISVSDNGMGFARETVRTILHSAPDVALESGFAHSGYDPTFSLRISRYLAEFMEGSFLMESLVGSGTTVTIRLPLVDRITALEARPFESPADRLHRPRILLVENDRLGRELISYFVRDRYSADVVSNGAKAIGLCRRYNYDAVVLDIRLGGTSMDGVDTLRKLREIEGYATTPAIAVSALADQGARERFLSAGFTEYIPKPFNRERLLTTLSSLLTLRGRSRDAT